MTPKSDNHIARLFLTNDPDKKQTSHLMFIAQRLVEPPPVPQRAGVHLTQWVPFSAAPGAQRWGLCGRM